MSCPRSCAPGRGVPSSSAASASSRPPSRQHDEPELLPEPADDPQDGFAFDVQRIVARHQGREGWTREGRRQLEQRRWEQGEPIPRAREDRLLLAAQRLEEQRD